MRNKTIDTALAKVYALPKALLIIFICIAFLAGCTAAQIPFKSDAQAAQDNTEKDGYLTPVPKTPDPSAGQKLEGNITAYDELKPESRAVLEHIAKEPGFPYAGVINLN